MRSLDPFLSRTYHKADYNCAHFVAEVWEYLEDFAIDDVLDGFLKAPSERNVASNIRHKFKKLEVPESPCIVLMNRVKSTPHVGLFVRNKVIHITESGVSFVSLEIASLGFTKLGFYTCVKL